MGHDFGDFRDEFRGILHLEYSGGCMVIWNANESEQILRLTPENAGKLAQKLTDALMMYSPDHLL